MYKSFSLTLWFYKKKTLILFTEVIDHNPYIIINKIFPFCPEVHNADTTSLTDLLLAVFSQIPSVSFFCVGPLPEKFISVHIWLSPANFRMSVSCLSWTFVLFHARHEIYPHPVWLLFKSVHSWISVVLTFIFSHYPASFFCFHYFAFRCWEYDYVLFLTYGISFQWKKKPKTSAYN